MGEGPAGYHIWGSIWPANHIPSGSVLGLPYRRYAHGLRRPASQTSGRPARDRPPDAEPICGRDSEKFRRARRAPSAHRARFERRLADDRAAHSSPPGCRAWPHSSVLGAGSRDASRSSQEAAPITGEASRGKTSATKAVMRSGAAAPGYRRAESLSWDGEIGIRAKPFRRARDKTLVSSLTRPGRTIEGPKTPGQQRLRRWGWSGPRPRRSRWPRPSARPSGAARCPRP